MTINIEQKFKNSFKEDRIDEYTPLDIESQLLKYVFGQDHAVRMISTMAAIHYKRLNDELEWSYGTDTILMAGPTGSGKTFIMQNLAEVLDLPFYEVEITSFTEAGYVGDDVENIIYNAVDRFGIEEAQKAIFFIDEIDKIAAMGGQGRDVNGKGVQQALLKLLDNKMITISANHRREQTKPIEVDTRNMLFVLAGAFSGIEAQVEKQKKKQMGFMQECQKAATCFTYADLKPHHFRKYGMLPEFLGRAMKLYVPLNEHSLESITQIVRNGKDSALRKAFAEYKAFGIDLRVEDSAIEKIAIRAMQSGHGARSINEIINNVTMQYLRILPNIDTDTFTLKANMFDKDYPINDEIISLSENIVKRDSKKVKLGGYNLSEIVSAEISVEDDIKSEDYGFEIFAKIAIPLGQHYDEVYYSYRPLHGHGKDAETLIFTHDGLPNIKISKPFCTVNNIMMSMHETGVWTEFASQVKKWLCVEDIKTDFYKSQEVIMLPPIDYQ